MIPRSSHLGILDVTIANLVCLVAGTALTWSSPVLLDLEDPEETVLDTPLNHNEASWISALLPIGAICGPFLFAFLADLIGRKVTLLICGLLFLLSFFAFAVAPNIWVFYVGRFVIGASVAGVFMVMPLYIAEMAESSVRGALGSSMNCFICFGFLFSFTVGSMVHYLIFNITLLVFPVIFIVLFAAFAGETPYFYVLKGDEDKARTSLRRIRDLEEAEEDEKLKRLQKIATERRTKTFFDVVRFKGNRKGFLICLGLLAFQQLSGINVVLFDAKTVFNAADPSLDPEVCLIIVGAAQFISSFWTPVVVDRVGRRVLLIISAVGIVISHFFIGAYYLVMEAGRQDEKFGFVPILCLAVYICSFNTGIAILPWSMLGEVLVGSVKSKASCMATSFTWFLGFFIAKYFRGAIAFIGLSLLFWFFALCTSLCIPFVVFYVIETKGKSLDEIQEILNG